MILQVREGEAGASLNSLALHTHIMLPLQRHSLSLRKAISYQKDQGINQAWLPGALPQVNTTSFALVSVWSYSTYFPGATLGLHRGRGDHSSPKVTAPIRGPKHGRLLKQLHENLPLKVSVEPLAAGLLGKTCPVLSQTGTGPL